MADDTCRERDDFRLKTNRSSSQREAFHSISSAGTVGPLLQSHGSLVDLCSKPGARGGAPVREAQVQRLQRSHGNRAVQRYLTTTTSEENQPKRPRVQVSRFEWHDALDSAVAASEWLNPSALPAKAATRVSGYADEYAQQNPDAGIVDIIGGTFNAERAHEREAAASVRSAEHTFGRGVEWAEGQVSGGANWLADQAQGIPFLGESARRTAGDVSNYAQIGTGVLKGAGTLVGGLAQMAVNPIDAVSGLFSLGEHVPTGLLGIPNPLKMAHNAYDVIANDKPIGEAANSVYNPLEGMRQDGEFFMNMGRGLLQPYGEALERGRIGEVVGRGAFDIGSLFIGAGEARGAAEVGQVVRGLEGVEAASAAARGIEGAGAARLAEGAEALRLAEGLEGARGAAAAAETGLMHKPIPTGKPVPAPIEFGQGVATTSPVPDIAAFGLDETTQVTMRAGESGGIGSAILDDAPATLPDFAPIRETPAPVRLSGPAPVELPPSTPTASPVPSGPFGLDETTEVIRSGEAGGVGSAIAEDTAATIPDAAPLKETPAPIEFGGGAKPASFLDKALDAFKKLIGGDTKVKDAPGEVTIPQELNKGMKDAWDKSLPGGKAQEHGGILVQNKDGSFQWLEAPPGKEGSIRLNYGDVGADQALAGSGHTHPYSAKEGGHTNVGFSSNDVSNLVKSDDPFKMVQSGDRQFASVKSEEFNAKVENLDAVGKNAMQAEMNKRWNEVFNDPKLKGKTLDEKVRAANQTVHSEYDLLYYEGEGGVLKQY